MKEIFEEYGLFVVSAIASVLVITIIFRLFAGETSVLAPFFETWLENFGLF